MMVVVVVGAGQEGVTITVVCGSKLVGITHVPINLRGRLQWGWLGQGSILNCLVIRINI